MKFLGYFIVTISGLLLVFFLFFSLGKDTQNNITSISFSSLPLSKNDAEKQKMRISQTFTVRYDDRSQKVYPLTYKVLAKMGDTIGTGKLGLMVNHDNDPIIKGGEEDVSEMPDGNSLITVGNKHYLFTHMEEVPGMIYRTEVKVEKNKLKAVETQAVDLSTMGGTLVNCASSKTTYGSHLGGEEDYSLNPIFADKNSPFYVDCALDGMGSDVAGELNYFCAYVDGMQSYLKDLNIDKENGYNGERFSPYNYGYIVEVQPQVDGTTKSTKHYVTGKYTPELAVMMPDNKTIYMSDDGTAKGLWKFVSDEAIKDFKAEWEGTLYAAKVVQISKKRGGSFTLSWIELGHAKDSEIAKLINTKMKITDIFTVEKPDENGTCLSGSKIYEDVTLECLTLKKGQEKAAAFLETRKYAALKGATVEFRKEEGLSYDADKNVLYLSVSQMTKSMRDNYKGKETLNDIRVKKNPCGAVYEMRLDDAYSGTSLKAIVLGKPLKASDNYAEEWRCHPDSIANPDNIMYIGHHTLLISEDTTRHVNNMAWAYNTQSKKLTRIASLPIGAEVTGVDTAVIDEKGILFMNIQHPFQDNPEGVEGTFPNAKLIENAREEDLKASIGYFDGLPSDIFK